MKPLLLLGSMILANTLFSQPKAESTNENAVYDYSRVDSTVLTNKNKHWTVVTLAKELTAGYQTEHEKVRALFRWITENIAYDCYAYHHPKGLSLDGFYTTHEYFYHRACITMQERKGVCEDYAVLFYEMCASVGIKCYVVRGQASQNDRVIRFFRKMKKFDTNHAWNKVSVDGKWYFVDATWASGATDKRVRIFTRSFNEDYFLTPVGNLYATHAENKTESADINDFMENPGYPGESKRYPRIDLFYCDCY